MRSCSLRSSIAFKKAREESPDTIVPVEICRLRDAILEQVATKVLRGDTANEAVEIGHGRRTFCLPALGGADGWFRRPSVTLG